ncbi:MAG: PCRF domain-containing protein, partial [Alphaproteobacteria bacterium]|nr:PCRF domain-containing protein [Alphaproteobacteria bacterium]
MPAIASQKLDQLLARFSEVESALNSGAGGQETYVRLSKEHAELTPVIQAIRKLRKVEDEISGLQEILADKQADPEMRSLAQAELDANLGEIPKLERHLQIMLLPVDEADAKNAILEVRAGTGGDEAALFAADLFRMYQRYADVHKWRFEIMHVSESDLGGIKDAAASIEGRNVFARLKYESGVHRVQRVPATEASGRIHTSAATVAVLPEAEEVDIKIEEKDL